MAREVSATALQAMLSQQTGEVFVPCLKIEHPSFAAPYRIAYNTETLHRSDGDYLPFAFQCNLPDQVEDSVPQVKVTIDNADLEISNAIRAVNGMPSITMDVVLASSPNTIEAGPFAYSLMDATVTADSINGTLGYEDDIFSQQVPGQSYLPTNSAGLFT